MSAFNSVKYLIERENYNEEKHGEFCDFVVVIEYDYCGPECWWEAIYAEDGSQLTEKEFNTAERLFNENDKNARLK